jgi:hypothetical protein
MRQEVAQLQPMPEVRITFFLTFPWALTCLLHHSPKCRALECTLIELRTPLLQRFLIQMQERSHVPLWRTSVSVGVTKTIGRKSCKRWKYYVELDVHVSIGSFDPKPQHPRLGPPGRLPIGYCSVERNREKSVVRSCLYQPRISLSSLSYHSSRWAIH